MATRTELRWLAELEAAVPLGPAANLFHELGLESVKGWNDVSISVMRVFATTPFAQVKPNGFLYLALLGAPLAWLFYYDDPVFCIELKNLLPELKAKQQEEQDPELALIPAPAWRAQRNLERTVVVSLFEEKFAVEKVLILKKEVEVARARAIEANNKLQTVIAENNELQQLWAQMKDA
jgi:hypothetical protein